MKRVMEYLHKKVIALYSKKCADPYCVEVLGPHDSHLTRLGRARYLGLRNLLGRN